jgi:hypothetical protein
MRHLISGELTNYSIVRTRPKLLHMAVATAFQGTSFDLSQLGNLSKLHCLTTNKLQCWLRYKRLQTLAVNLGQDYPAYTFWLFGIHTEVGIRRMVSPASGGLSLAGWPQIENQNFGQKLPS